MSLYSNNTDIKVIKRVKLTPSLQKRNPEVTVWVQVVKLDEEASGLKDNVVRLGKGTESSQKVRIRDAMYSIHIISHTQSQVHLKFKENIVQKFIV